MIRRILPALGLCLFATAAMAQNAAPAAAPAPAAPAPHNRTPEPFRYIPDKEMAAMVASETQSPVSPTLTDHEDFYIVTSGRTRSGVVETHAHWVDYMIVISGDATLLYGGTLTNPPTPTPTGEMYGGTIVGGQSVELHPGDYFQIPPGMPHQMLLKPGAKFRYFVVKTRL